MRCKFCNKALEQYEYEWNEERCEWVERAEHSDGTCVDLQHVDASLDVHGYYQLDDFDEVTDYG